MKMPGKMPFAMELLATWLTIPALCKAVGGVLNLQGQGAKINMVCVCRIKKNNPTQWVLLV